MSLPPFSAFTEFVRQILDPRPNTSPPASVDRVTALPSAQPAAVVGFGNLSNNCWANAVLQMIVGSPPLLQAYLAVGNHYRGTDTDPKRPRGEDLLEVYRNYQACKARGCSVPAADSQKVRAFLHHFEKDGIRPEADSQADAYEALGVFLSIYDTVLKKQSGLSSVINAAPNPDYHAICPPFFVPVGQTIVFTPSGAPYARDATRHYDSHDLCLGPYLSSRTENTCQIQVNLLHKTHLAFDELLQNTLHERNGQGDAMERLLTDGTVQRFVPTETRIQFVEAPQLLILSLLRFVQSREGRAIKIGDPVAVPRTLTLPSTATVTGESLHFELTSFVVHIGASATSGHYIAYQKCDGLWYCLNDSSAERVTEQKVDEALKKSYFHHYQRTAHPTAFHPARPINLPRDPETLGKEFLATDLLEKKRILELLKSFATSLAVPDLSRKTQLFFYNQIKLAHPELVGRWHYAIWVDKGMPQQPEYGKRTCEENFHSLKIQTPWIASRGGNLIQQSICLQEEEIQNTERHLINRQLLSLSNELTKNPSSEDHLQAIFKKLPKEVHWKIHGKIYEARKSKDPTIRDPHYGKHALEHERLQTLLAEQMPSGRSIIEEMLHDAQTEESHYARDKEAREKARFDALAQAHATS